MLVVKDWMKICEVKFTQISNLGVNPTFSCVKGN